MRMRKTSWYLKLNLELFAKKKLVVLMHQTNGSFTYCHKITRLLKNIVLSPIYAN